MTRLQYLLSFSSHYFILKVMCSVNVRNHVICLRGHDLECEGSLLPTIDFFVNVYVTFLCCVLRGLTMIIDEWLT